MQFLPWSTRRARVQWRYAGVRALRAG